eukprot:583346-Pyramimonas_sp.AAC.1
MVERRGRGAREGVDSVALPWRFTPLEGARGSVDFGLGIYAVKLVVALNTLASRAVSGAAGATGVKESSSSRKTLTATLRPGGLYCVVRATVSSFRRRRSDRV